MSGIKHDPKENDPKYKDKIEKAKREAEKLCKDRKGEMGYCHAVWGKTKTILKEKYNIDWKSPAELNPYCKFD